VIAAACVVTLIHCSVPAQPGSLVAHYSFEDAGEAVADRTGNGHDGSAPGCGRTEGRLGNALLLDGQHGMVVESAPDLQLRQGFSIEFWLWLDAVPSSVPVNLLSKENEFLLRLDRQQVGGTISFYPHVGGSYEPRIRGTVPAAQRWHHVVASWDGKVARLFVDGVGYSSPRAGEIAPGDAPTLIGGPCPSGAGTVGRLDEVRFHSVAIGPQRALELALAPEGPSGETPLAECRFDLTRPDHAASFSPIGATSLQPTADGLQIGVSHPNDGIVCSRLEVDLARSPGVECAIASDGGSRGTLLFVTSEGAGTAPFVVNADGRPHACFVNLRRCSAWQGKLHALALRPSDVATASVTLRSLRVLAPEECPPKLSASALRPEVGWVQPRETVAGTWLLGNDGPLAQTVSVRIVAQAGQAELLTPAELVLQPGEEHVASWQLVVGEAAQVDVSATAIAGSVRQQRVCSIPIRQPVSMSSIESVLTAGFPRAMDFRHLGPTSVPVHAHNQVLLVDLLGDKIAAARDFKQRLPDRVVLMQVNDEPNGMWGSWFTVPEGFARKEGLRFRPEVFPSPEFAGYWLLAPGCTTQSDLPAEGAEVTVVVDHPARLRVRRRSGEYLADVLVYARENGRPDFARADFATVTAIDEQAATVTLSRWPSAGDRPWHAFGAGQAVIAPSSGDIYGMRGKLLKTWLPNLTKFCPRDPDTGLNGAQWWARHFAHLYREHIAAGDGPVPDGFEFDWPPFWAHNLSADCDNDGEADGCELDGVSYWALGMHDCFYHLRNGGPGFEGIGQDALLLADSSGPNSQRSFDLLNGAENEEFPGGTDFRTFSAQLDLYLLWCREAREPRLSYLQSRFPSELSADDLCGAALLPTFHVSSRLRLNIAAACMGLGIHTYRDNSKRDVGSILDGGSDVEYDLDEHHAGDEGTYGWLGRPVGDPTRLDTEGQVLLRSPGVEQAFEPVRDGYEFVREGDEVTAAPLEPVEHSFPPDAAPVPALQATVTSLRSAGDPTGGLGGWTSIRLRRMGAAKVVSPPVDAPVAAGEELALTMWVDADPQYDDLEGPRYAALKREIGLRLEDGEATGYMHTILVGPTPRRVEHGVVLLNGSATTPWDFSLAQVFPGLTLERLRGSQCPQVNTGEPVGGTLRLGPMDGAFLSTAGA